MAPILLFVVGMTASAWGAVEDRRLQAVSPEQKTFTLESKTAGDKKGQVITVTGADDASIKAFLKTLGKGDVLTVPIPIVENKVALSDVQTQTKYIGFGSALLATVIGLIAVFLYIYIVSGGQPRNFIIGTDNRYSGSKFQMTLWLGVIGIAYVATVFLRAWYGGSSYLGGVDLTSNLLALMGISGVAAGGAKAITTLKDTTGRQQNALADAGTPPGAPPPAPAPVKTTGTPQFWRDLTRNDAGEWDMGDVQVLVVTVIAVIAFAMVVIEYWGTGIQLVAHTTLPDVNIGLTALFGGGIATYLLKKIGGTVGQS